jgi:endo-1,4-beta-xylanase
MRPVLFSLLPLLLCAQPRATEIKLWPQGAPGFESLQAEEVSKPSVAPVNAKLPGNFTVAHYPSIYVFLPPKEKATGVGVVIAPGGGHRQLVIEKEGWEMADWFNERGIAAFVLKYRLAKAPGVTQYTLAEHVHQDAARAMRLVRSRSAAFGLNPDRIGFMGFSAGGEVAGMIGTKFDAGNPQSADAIERASSRPDFNILIYPWYRPGANQPNDPPLFPIPANAPPHFLLCTDDDRSHVEPTVKYYLELEAAKIPTEMHVHAYGGHGFGLRPTKKPAPVMDWPKMMMAWLEERGLLR